VLAAHAAELCTLQDETRARRLAPEDHAALIDHHAADVWSETVRGLDHLEVPNPNLTFGEATPHPHPRVDDPVQLGDEARAAAQLEGAALEVQRKDLLGAVQADDPDPAGAARLAGRRRAAGSEPGTDGKEKEEDSRRLRAQGRRMVGRERAEHQSSENAP